MIEDIILTKEEFKSLELKPKDTFGSSIIYKSDYSDDIYLLKHNENNYSGSRLYDLNDSGRRCFRKIYNENNIISQSREKRIKLLYGKESDQDYFNEYEKSKRIRG